MLDRGWKETKDMKCLIATLGVDQGNWADKTAEKVKDTELVDGACPRVDGVS
jgi:hypothetical protein